MQFQKSHFRPYFKLHKKCEAIMMYDNQVVKYFISKSLLEIFLIKKKGGGGAKPTRSN